VEARPKRCRAALAAFLVAAVAPAAPGCEGLSRLGELRRLQQSIAREFDTPGTTVTISNGRHMTVVLDNSPAMSGAPEVREILARSVAEHVRDNYAGYGRLDSITIQADTSRRVGIFTEGTTETVATFSRDDLRLGRAEGKSGRDAGAKASP
jgi:hypothetical protein